jgi:hypothetical protein
VLIRYPKRNPIYISFEREDMVSSEKRLVRRQIRSKRRKVKREIEREKT